MSQSSLNDPSAFSGDHTCPWRIPDEQAALIFVQGQFLFRHTEPATGRTTIKFVAPASVATAFAQTESPFGIRVDSGWLIPNILRWGIGVNGEWVAWYAAPAVRELTFETDAQFVPAAVSDNAPADRITVRVPVPGLVFLGYAAAYFVWAVTRQPKADTPTFHAPLPNVDATGHICFGSNDVPPAASRTIAAAWELFLRAPFNSHQANGKSRRQPEDVRAQLFDLARRQRRRYPTGDLVATNRTLDQACAAVLRGDR